MAWRFLEEARRFLEDTVDLSSLVDKFLDKVNEDIKKIESELARRCYDPRDVLDFQSIASIEESDLENSLVHLLMEGGWERELFRKNKRKVWRRIKKQPTNTYLKPLEELTRTDGPFPYNPILSLKILDIFKAASVNVWSSLYTTYNGNNTYSIPRGIISKILLNKNFDATVIHETQHEKQEREKKRFSEAPAELAVWRAFDSYIKRIGDLSNIDLIRFYLSYLDYKDEIIKRLKKWPLEEVIRYHLLPVVLYFSGEDPYSHLEIEGIFIGPTERVSRVAQLARKKGLLGESDFSSEA